MSRTHEQEAERLISIPRIVETRREMLQSGARVYVATYPGVDGCVGQGATPEEAREDLKAAFREYVLTHLERGWSLPKACTSGLAAPDAAQVSTDVSKSGRERQRSKCITVGC